MLLSLDKVIHVKVSYILQKSFGTFSIPMNTNTKTVLLFQASRFQAEVWRSSLWEHNIIVIWEENYANKQDAEDYFKRLELKPNLLIIDLKTDNAYEICRCFSQYYPTSKIILTTDPQDGDSSAILRWAVNQGVDELLVNFQKEHLFSSVITNVNSVLRLLEYPPLKQKSLARTLGAFGQTNINAPIAQKTIDLQPSSLSISNSKSKDTTVKSTSPIARISFFLIAVLSIALILDGSRLFMSSPVEALQRKILVSNKNIATNSRINSQTFRDIYGVPQGIFNYGGSTTWATIQNIVNSRITEEYPDFKLRYLSAINATPGSGTGIRMLLGGELDFSQSSRSIKPEEHILAYQQGFTLREYHVAIDAIAIAVHPSLPISRLTLEQLKQIYLGEITNWRELNGLDLEIKLFSRREEDGGTPEFFKHHILQNQSFSSSVNYVNSTTDGLRQVMETPGAIYYASAPQIVSQCRVKALSIANQEEEFISPYASPVVPPEECYKYHNKLNIKAIENASYPITRYLSVIVRQDGTRAQKAGEAYAKLLLTPEIQILMEEAGFVPIN